MVREHVSPCRGKGVSEFGHRVTRRRCCRSRLGGRSTRPSVQLLIGANTRGVTVQGCDRPAPIVAAGLTKTRRQHHAVFVHGMEQTHCARSVHQCCADLRSETRESTEPSCEF